LGQEVKNLDIPIKAGFYFGGWYEDSEFKNRAKYINSSITLHARWISASDDDFTSSEGLWFEYVDGVGYVLTYYEGSDLDVLVPRIYNDGYNGFDYVVAIGPFVFYDLTLDSVQLPNTIDILQEYAFNHASIDQLIFLGDAPTNVDETAFFGSDLIIYRTETALNWPGMYFYYTNVRLVGDIPLKPEVEFYSQIELWNESSLFYADMMYSDSSIDWISYMETKDPVAKAELIALSNLIVAGLSTDEEKVYAIYNWVASNIEYSLESAYLTEYDAYKSLSGVCFQYAQLVNELLRAQNIASIKVSGYYYLGFNDFESLMNTTTSLETSKRHAWNYVLVNGEWIIVDATHQRFDISHSEYNSSLWAESVEYVTYFVEEMDMSLRDGIYLINNELYYVNRGLIDCSFEARVYFQDNQYFIYLSNPDLISNHLDSWEGLDFIRNEWIEYEGNLYYARADGQLYYDVTVMIDGNYYSFDEDGKLAIEALEIEYGLHSNYLAFLNENITL
jgi:transglutaminase-like putative cysteine protease